MNKTEIFADYSAFWNRTDKKLNGVTQAFADLNPDFAKKNETNEGCFSSDLFP